MAGVKGKSGGARTGSGPTVRRLQLSKEAAQELRILTSHRRALTNNQALQPADIATQLIHAAWLEYDAMIQAAQATAEEYDL